MIDKNILALVVTLAIIGGAALLMRSGTRWLETKLNAARTPRSSRTEAGEVVRYPSRVCAGKDAVAAWEQAKTEGRGVPLIVALPHTPGVWRLARRPEDILRLADKITEPFAIDALQREPTVWPDDVVTQMESTVIKEVHHGQLRYLPEVHIIHVPARDASEIPAYLDLGGWNSCPPAEIMVAALRAWQSEFGAEIVAIGTDTMDIRVARRPQTRDAALKLAREQVMFCSDVVENPEEMLEVLAATLMVSDWWHFWWD